MRPLRETPEPINVARLARTWKADNWLHEHPYPRRRWPTEVLLLVAVALHGVIVLGGLALLGWWGIIR